MASDGWCDDNCEICGGTGWLRRDVPVNHKDFGELFPCHNREEKTIGAFVRSGLDPAEYHLRWDDLYSLGNVDAAKRVLKKTLDRGYGLVFIYGEWGLGKTTLMKVSVSTWLDSGRGNAAYANTSHVLDVVRSAAFDADGDNVKGDLLYWSNCRLLCLDEFDKVRDTPYASEKRFQLLDERYVMATRQQAVTIISSNDPPSEYDGYIADRLRDGRCNIVEMKGRSVRPGLSFDD